MSYSTGPTGPAPRPTLSLAPPQPIRLAFPHPGRLLAYGASLLQGGRTFRGALRHNITAALRLDYQRALARLDMGDPDPEEHRVDPSDAALTLAMAVYPDGHRVLLAVLRDERRRRMRAEKLVSRAQIGLAVVGLALAGFLPVVIYRLGVRALGHFMPGAEYLDLMGIALACTAFVVYHPFFCRHAEPPAAPVALESFMPAGPGDMALNVRVSPLSTLQEDLAEHEAGLCRKARADMQEGREA